MQIIEEVIHSIQHIKACNILAGLELPGEFVQGDLVNTLLASVEFNLRKVFQRLKLKHRIFLPNLCPDLES